MTDKVQVRGTSYENGFLVLMRYTKRQLQLGQIVSIVIKNETTVILLLREKNASWVPELGVYELEKIVLISSFAKILTSLVIFFPLSFYQKGARSLLLLKHMPLWS